MNNISNLWIFLVIVIINLERYVYGYYRGINIIGVNSCFRRGIGICFIRGSIFGNINLVIDYGLGVYRI